MRPKVAELLEELGKVIDKLSDGQPVEGIPTANPMVIDKPTQMN